MRSRYVIAGLLVAGLVAAGCEKQPASNGSTAGKPAESAKLPDGLFLEREPADVKEVATLKSSAKPGESVVVRGRIGRQGDRPFVADRAVFTLVDRSLLPCNEKAGETCPTPWDYCCEDKATMAANTLTVFVVGPDGRPLPRGLEGEHALAPLSEVVIVGKVNKASDQTSLTIDATGIFVKPKS